MGSKKKVAREIQSIGMRFINSPSENEGSHSYPFFTGKAGALHLLLCWKQNRLNQISGVVSIAYGDLYRAPQNSVSIDEKPISHTCGVELPYHTLDGQNSVSWWRITVAAKPDPVTEINGKTTCVSFGLRMKRRNGYALPTLARTLKGGDLKTLSVRERRMKL